MEFGWNRGLAAAAPSSDHRALCVAAAFPHLSDWSQRHSHAVLTPDFAQKECSSGCGPRLQHQTAAHVARHLVHGSRLTAAGAGRKPVQLKLCKGWLED